MAAPKRSSVKIDAIRLEVIRNRLTTIADEMAVSLQRSAYSTNIKTRRDHSCAIFDADVRMVAQSFSQPVHLGSLSHFVPRIVSEYGRNRLRLGDGILCNDGYRGGNHLNDICLVSPVFHDGGIIAFVANIAHHLDVGGSTPGSMFGHSTEILHEGMRIPPTRLIANGAIDTNIFNLFVNNVRAVRETAGDLRAQLASASVGQRRIVESVGKFGRKGLRQAMTQLLDYTEQRTREEIRRIIPDGIYSAEDFMDGDGNDETPAKVAVTIAVSKDGVVFDLAGSDPQRRGPINATYTMTLSCCAYALKALLSPDLPTNDGFYRVMKVVAPEGPVACASFPAPIGGGWETANRITETAFQAFAKVIPERLAAGSKGCFTGICPAGLIPETNEYFAFFDSLCGGYGARATKDGIDGIQAHGQNTENAPIEETEANYPVEIVRYELIPNSEGPGRFRGGLGVRRDYRFRSDVTFSVMSDRAKFPPWGLMGGGTAARFRIVLNPGANEKVFGSKVSFPLTTADVVSVQNAGGGGFGSPLLRDPDQVAGDVRADRISVERARSVYGVVIDRAGIRADLPSTSVLRSKMSA